MLAASDGIVNAQAPGVAASALVTLNNSKANNNTAGGGGGIANGVPQPGPIRLIGGRVAAEHRLLHAPPGLTAALVRANPQPRGGTDHHAALAAHRRSPGLANKPGV